MVTQFFAAQYRMNMVLVVHFDGSERRKQNRPWHPVKLLRRNVRPFSGRPLFEKERGRFFSEIPHRFKPEGGR